MRKNCWIEGVLRVHSNSKVRNELRELSGGMRINGKDFQDKSSICGNGEHARDRSILYLLTSCYRQKSMKGNKDGDNEQSWNHIQNSQPILPCRSVFELLTQPFSDCRRTHG